ncbi:MAG TPA: hypothetical protein VGD68_03690 [Streptosporangiaceae bacterium]
METATQKLHRLTSYEPGRDWDAPVDDPAVVQDLQANDFSRLPWFVKRYPGELARLPLPRELPPTQAPAMAVLAGTAGVRPAPLDLAQLSRLLYLSAGVVRTMERPYGAHPFRAAGSAGGRFPLELYVAAPPGGPLPAGVHWYDPWGHALVRVGPPPRAGGPVVVVTGVPWRTGWRYRERGYRHVYWDAGTMLAQLLALADSAGLTAALYTSFPDPQVAALVGVDRVHEFPVALVALDGTAPAAEPAGPAVAGEVDAAPVEFPLVTAAQRAGEGDRFGRPWGRGGPVTVPLRASLPVEDVITVRGSQRRMDARRGLPGEVLRASMAVAVRGLEMPHWVVVHDVTGLPSGVYRWPGLDRPLRTGALRDELHRVCLNQALARDAAFLAVAATDLTSLGEPGYRAAHLAAGLAEGRLHLAAYALGASASGMTFLDSEVPGLLGQACDGLLFTCVGVPQYRSSPGGPPGAPATVRRVAPAK